MLEAVMNAPKEDKLVKNAFADFAAEHFEIACYNALITAAEELDDMETLQVCQAILGDEENMAYWLEENLPMAVRMVLPTTKVEVTA